MAPVSSLSELCQRCGLCCDGALFTVTPLEAHEVEPLRARALLPLARKDGAPALAQPCAALSGLRCTIYAERPASCRRYQCLLYGALAEGEVSLDEALAVVADARARVDARAEGRESFLDHHFRGQAARR